jgi:hypothetical protein
MFRLEDVMITILFLLLDCDGLGCFWLKTIGLVETFIKRLFDKNGFYVVFANLEKQAFWTLKGI